MGKKILIIEDHPDARRILALSLRHLGYEALEAQDGYAGIAMGLAEHPDLILLDLGLPGLTGIDTAKRIKADAETTQIPIVAYTAWHRREMEAKARDAGVVEYLVKPTPVNMIAAVIERLTEKNSSAHQSKLQDPAKTKSGS
jgi:two-component system KDP operon response regulator KdpE